MDINILYDYKTPNGFIPNGLNPAFLYPFINNDFIFNHIALMDFEKKYRGVSTWFGEQVIEPVIQNEILVSDYDYNTTPNSINLYVITPFGGASSTYGYDYTYNENKSFFYFIPKKTIDLLKNDKSVFLFINYSNEGGIDFNWFRIIHRDSEKFGIPLNKIIFCISDYFIDMNYSIWKQTDGIEDMGSINLLYLNWSLNSKARELFEIYNGRDTNFNGFTNKCSIPTKNDIDDTNIRPYKFLMMNRRLRPHRIYSVSLFYSMGIMDECLVSYDIQTMLTSQMDFHSVNTNIEDDKITTNIINSFNELKLNNPKKIIDYDDLENVWGFNFEKKEPYLDSYIHITSETNFFEIGGYFSEKTWKPIGNLQPFIFMGPACGLVELKKLGFKTFSPFIDESYDLELDPTIRFKMIINEIERLSKLSTEEIHNWYHSIFTDIILYNQKKLFQHSNYMKTKDMVTNKLIKSINYDNTKLI
jgi:hypothetical protein